MKQIHYLSFLLILSISVSFVSCKDDDDKKGLETAVTDPSWILGKPLLIGVDSILQVHFNAAAPWTAHTYSKWCSMFTSSGEKGPNTLKLLATSEATVNRTSTITIKVEGFSPISLEVTQKLFNGNIRSLNTQVDQYLRKNYLWNDEYKTLDLDYTKDYDDFFYGALRSLTTNTLDKRPYKGSDGRTHYKLFSHIRKKNIISSTRAYPSIKKELEFSFGITGMLPIRSGNGVIEYCIEGVYPDSPASRAGMKRGAYISKINGNVITSSNYVSLYNDLLSPKNIHSLEITERVPGGNNTTSPKKYTITSEAMYKNPVIYQKVIETDPRYKIGYLVYDSFAAGFDDKLFEVFKEFKNQNVNELILDLRYNGGGHVISANLIASCIAGNAYKDAVFEKLRYNDERMEARGNKKKEEKFMYSNYKNLNTPLSAGDLSLSRVYCLVGSGTASASELVINSLKGIGIDVVLIGKRTTGKNVGMEPKDIKVGEDSYEVVPITFQSYNAKDFGDYEGGFSPDIPLDERHVHSNFFEGYIDYGDMSEPLLSRAIQEITGKIPPKAVRRVMTRGIGSEILEAPAVFRPGHDGMLKTE